MVYRLIPDFTNHWNFQPSASSWQVRWERARAWRSKAHFPQHALLRKPSGLAPWIVYFLYAPRGALSQGQRLALRNIKDMGLCVHVVCAAPEPNLVPKELHQLADGLHWKALAGYDISGYTLGLLDIAAHAPGSTAFVLNDSVWGPVVDLRPFLLEAAWDLTGLTALNGDENHIQSYAWILKDVTPQRLNALASILSERFCYNWSDHVVARQEVPLARVAAQSMSVGSFLYSKIDQVGGDATLSRAFELLDAGHPFLKKSLLGKMSHCQDVERVAAWVVEHGFAGPSTAKR